MFYPMEENESEEREQEQLLMVICPIPTYNSSTGYPRDHRLLLIETHTPLQRATHPSCPFISPDKRAQPACSYQIPAIQVIDAPHPALTTPTPNARELYFGLLRNKNVKLQNIVGGAVRLGKKPIPLHWWDTLP